MKINLTFLIVLLALAHIHAQDYKLTFSLEGEVNSIDSVMVENVTQNTRIKLNGNDTLFLTKTETGISTLQNSESFRLKAFPNPSSTFSNLQITSWKHENIVVRIFDIGGREIISKKYPVIQGIQTVQLKNLPTGIFIAQVSSQSKSEQIKLISYNNSNSQPEIGSIYSEQVKEPGLITKSAADARLLDYEEYDNIIVRVWPTDSPWELRRGFVMLEAEPLPDEKHTFVFEYVRCQDTCGNFYNTVQIGDQIWMAENFRCFTDSSWIYDNDESNGELYGRLYTFEDALNNAPDGWHLPTNDEWLEMTSYVQSIYKDELLQALKSKTGWSPDENQNDTNGNDASGFNMVPGGARWFYDRTFYNAGNSAYFWTSTRTDSIRANIRKFTGSNNEIGLGSSNVAYGFSVRYVKDDNGNGGDDDGDDGDDGGDDDGGDNDGGDDDGGDNGGGDDDGGDNLIEPDFNEFGPYCKGSLIPALPTVSPNDISGQWSPVIDNTKAGITEYTFTPNEGQNADTVKRSITIVERIDPIFDVQLSYHSGDNIPGLPEVSTNNIAGKWSPAINNTKTTAYTFTPNAEYCANEIKLTITITEDIIPKFNVYGPYCEEDNIPALSTISFNNITGTWFPEINNKQSTTYYFTPDEGQKATGFIIFIEITPKTIPTFDVKTSYPKDADIPALPDVSNEGIAGFWEPELNNQETTAYTFRPIGDQCADTFKLTITIQENNNEGYFTDSRDGKIYKTITIGNQTWMAENLAYLPKIDSTKNNSSTEPYYYVYGYEGENVSSAKATDNYNTFGVLYNWTAAKSACPAGWHLPDSDEWNQLKSSVNNNGKALAATTCWLDSSYPKTIGYDMASNNSSGFSALGGGYYSYVPMSAGIFSLLKFAGSWWTSTEKDESYAERRDLYYYDVSLNKESGSKSFGYSVRCVKD